MIMTQFGLTVTEMRLCFGLALAILITGTVHASNDENAERTITEDEKADFSQISHIVSRNSFVDVSLNRESFEEKCYVQPPYGQLTESDIFAKEGVKVQNNSYFVSCRITIGPMTEELLGYWRLCGKSTTTGQVRCQPISIIWGIGNGNVVPPPSPLLRQTHRVNFGDLVNANVNETREMSTCHVVTPNGEDLVITPDVNYPHIERTTDTPCSIVVNDVTRDTLGDWSVYGRFDHGMFGQRNIRQPFTLELYDDVNKYNEISLPSQKHRVKLGSDLTVDVTHAEGTVETCIYASPSGRIFTRSSDTSTIPKGVQFRGVNERGVCGINFNPVTEDIFGQWEIIGRFRNGEVIDKKRLTFDIIEKVFDEDDIRMLNQINHFAQLDASVDISLNKEPFEEECYIRPPNGDFTRANLLPVEGVRPQRSSNFVSCRVTIDLYTSGMFGLWTLCGKSVESKEIRCQPASIALRTGNWEIRDRPQFTHPVHFGGSVNPGVSEGGTVESCHVVTPAGEDLALTTAVNYPNIIRSTGNLCSVVIENITQDMLGPWLIYGTFNSILRRTVVRLPLVFNLFDENNPHSQAYNVTVLPRQNHLVHVGTNLSLEVRQRTGDRQDCIYTAPSGAIFSINENNSGKPRGVHFNTLETTPVCEIVFDPITEEAVGEWQISLRFRNGVLFDEIRQNFRIVEEDPENPLQEDIVRTGQYLPAQHINTIINTTHRIVVSSVSLLQHESCHIIAPDGRQYAFIDGFNVPNVEIINENFVECGVILHVAEENMVGTWTLLARARSFADPIERRLPVTIRVEENFVLQNDMHIREGSDLYLHLNDAITVPETCTLIGPDGNEVLNVESDPIFPSSCGYIIRDVSQVHNGTWIIEYGARIKRRGSVDVEVLDSTTLSIDDLQWNVGDSIDISVGPKNAVYCVIKDSNENVVFDNFGQCKIVVNRVTINHRGNWTMQIGKPGTLQLQNYNFNVKVYLVAGFPIVTTNVLEKNTSLRLICSVPARHDIHACKFRDPRGNILVAAHGVGEDNYMFKKVTVNYQANPYTHDCILRLINPTFEDLGIWRCGLDTSTGTHHGFLTVDRLHDQEIPSDVITKPTLRSADVEYFEGDPVTLSCSIPTSLRYCYFRSLNGTIYNVFPRMTRSENFEYVGAGLDAGECGIRFKSLSTREGGPWSCHVGLTSGVPELRENILATIRAKMTVKQYLESPQKAVVQATIHSGQTIDYCRFVRSDGKGFSSYNVPSMYFLPRDMLYEGACILNIDTPNAVEMQPWTIAVKLLEGGGEISMTTVVNQYQEITISRSRFSSVIFWLSIVLVCILILAAVGACFPKKNRDWTFKRSSQLNQSIRSYFDRSMDKKPPMTANQHA